MEKSPIYHPINRAKKAWKYLINLPRNIQLVYLYELVGGILFFLPIIALYFEKELFSMTNVALIFSIEAIAIAMFEIPSGAFADLFGRKRSMVLANIICFIAIFFLYIGGNLTNFIIFAILSALARSLVSGTENALIYDTLLEEKREKEYKKIIGITYALWPIGASISSIAGGYIASYEYSLTALFSLIPIFLCIILTLILKEPEYEKENHKNILLQMKNATKFVFSKRQLIIIFVAWFFLLGIGESIHHFNSLFFDLKGIPIVYFGYVSAVIFALSSLGHYLSHNISELFGNKKTLIIAASLSTLFTLFATYTDYFLAVIFFVIPSFFFGIRRPVVDHILNKETPSGKRATVMSVNNFFGCIGFGLFTLALGQMSGLFGLNIAVRISMFILFIVPVLYMFLKDE